VGEGTDARILVVDDEAEIAEVLTDDVWCIAC
jgi:CheY-like chemotaxis protein